MSNLKPNAQNSKVHKLDEIIVVGSPQEYPQLAYFESELRTLMPNADILVIDSYQLRQISNNLPKQTILLILTKTILDLSFLSILTLNKNNQIFYKDSPKKSGKYIKVSNRWEFYKILLKKI